MESDHPRKQYKEKTFPISSPLRNIQRASESQQAPGERPQLFNKGSWRQIDMSRLHAQYSFQTWDCYDPKARACQSVTTPYLKTSGSISSKLWLSSLSWSQSYIYHISSYISYICWDLMGEAIDGVGEMNRISQRMDADYPCAWAWSKNRVQKQPSD